MGVSITHGRTQPVPTRKGIGKNMAGYQDMGMKTRLQFQWEEVKISMGTKWTSSCGNSFECRQIEKYSLVPMGKNDLSI